MGISILALLVIVAAGLTILIARHSRRDGRIVVAILIGLPVLVLAWLWSVRSYSARVPPTPIRVNQYAQSTAWTSEAGQTMQADVYPSAAAAVEAAARLLPKDLHREADTRPSRPRLTVTGNMGDVTQGALERAAAVLRASGLFENVVVAGNAPPQVGAGLATFRIAEMSTFVGGSEGRLGPSRSGAIRAEYLESGQAIAQLTLNYIDKPWVENPSLFLSRSPGTNWLIVPADEPSTSSDEASQRARRVAAARLAPAVGDALERDHFQAGGPVGWAGQAERIRSRVENALAQDQCVVDRFTQRFSRPYGDVWQQWLLIDASSRQIESLADAVVGPIEAARRSWIGRGLSVVGILAVVCLVYFFLNAATRGYYAWSLRAAAIALAAAGALLVLMIA